MTPSQESATNSRAPHILLRATNWIGDSVMMMPAVQRLREHYPTPAHLVLLCPAKLHDLWRHNPFVDEVLTFDHTMDIRALRIRHFDLTVIFPNSFRSAWEAWRAGIPRRIGYGGHARRFLLTDVVREPRGDRPTHRTLSVDGKRFRVKRFEPMRHQVHHHLDLVGHLGGNRASCPPRIWLGADAPALRDKFLSRDPRPVIGLNAGAEYGPAKRWFPDRFAAVARRVSDKIASRWLLLGGPGDVEIASTIEAVLHTQVPDRSSIINAAGKTTLLELCALVQSCKVFLTNDTGPMHLAAALDVPLVTIFGSTSPELTGPLSEQAVVIRHPVECSPCFLRECPIDFRCMTHLTVDEVANAVAEKLLRGDAPPTANSPRRIRGEIRGDKS